MVAEDAEFEEYYQGFTEARVVGFWHAGRRARPDLQRWAKCGWVQY